MAKRSDFAQKLLDDLRLRKERMSVSQSSKTAQPMTGDAYSHSKQAYRGSRDMKLQQNMQLKSGRSHSRSTGGNKSLSIRESSQDIVPLGRGQSSEQFRDLSMALAFALDGGKVTRTNSSDTSLMLRFLNQIGGRSVKTNKMERNNIVMHNRSTNNMPSISHLHINEIAKGAQKLNQILKAFPNGLNLDGYSIEIGNELLKGAMNLEESLRMLVNFQENSDYVIGSQNKARITLLDDDEDDSNDAITVENKQLARPVFSFDKSSRSSQHIQELYERLISQTYQQGNTNYSRNRKPPGTSNSASQRKSASVAFLEQKNQSSSTKSNPEKGRIPNVIAKLMGLEELPESDNAKHIIKKEPAHKEKIDRTEVKKNEGNNAQIRRHKQAHPNQVQLTQDSHHLQVQRDLASHRKSFDATIHSTKPPQKDVDGTKMSGRSKKVTDKHENNTGHTGNRKNVLGKEGKLQRGKEKGGAKESILKHEQQKMATSTNKVSGTATAIQEQAKSNLTMPRTERRNDYLQPLNGLTKSPFYLASQQPEARDMHHHQLEVDQQSKKQEVQETGKLQSENMSLPTFMQRYIYSTKTTPRTGGSFDLSRVMKSMGLPNTGHQEDAVQNRNALDSNTKMQESMKKNKNQNSSPGNFTSEVMKERNRNSSTTEVGEKIMHNVQVKNVQKVVAARKVDELASRSRNLHKLAGTSKHLPPMLQEVKQRRHNTISQSSEDNHGRLSKSTESEARILKSNKLGLSTATQYGQEELQIRAERGSSFCTLPVNDECQNPESLEIVARDGHGIVKLATAINNRQRQRDNQKLQYHKNGSDPPNLGISDGRIDATHSQLQKRYEPEPLTENEDNLLQILVKSQLFLDTAAALFKLNVPLTVLDTNCDDHHCEGNKLMLDCGCELMRRKGRRREISHHPFAKFHITSPKIRHLNDLIKQLHKDFEKLKFYCRNDKIGCDYQKMIEVDVYDKDPDVNCMWDYGWHKMMFMSLEKEDVIKDLEKHVLNGLLDDLTMDLLVF